MEQTAALDGRDAVANFKLLIIGDSGVGKSSLLLRYINDSFESRLPATIGVDYRVKIATTPNGTMVKLSIWDTAGQERFRTLTPNFYRGAHAAVIVFDVTNRESFDRLTNWMEELDTFSSRADITCMLVGNKIDHTPRRVSREEGLRYARLHQMPYAEASAKTSEGVNRLFAELVAQLEAVAGKQSADSRLSHRLTGSRSHLIDSSQRAGCC